MKSVLKDILMSSYLHKSRNGVMLCTKHNIVKVLFLPMVGTAGQKVGERGRISSVIKSSY